MSRYTEFEEDADSALNEEEEEDAGRFPCPPAKLGGIVIVREPFSRPDPHLILLMCVDP